MKRQPLSSDRGRDAEMDVVLRSTMPRLAGGTGNGCPAADELAAFVDQAVSEAERQRLEAHFSTCDRCQKVLAAMANMPPIEGVRAAEGRDRTRLAWLWARWLVPAGAAAGAFALYLAVRPAPLPAPPMQTAQVTERAPAAVAERNSDTAGQALRAPSVVPTEEGAGRGRSDKTRAPAEAARAKAATPRPSSVRESEPARTGAAAARVAAAPKAAPGKATIAASPVPEAPRMAETVLIPSPPPPPRQAAPLSPAPAGGARAERAADADRLVVARPAAKQSQHLQPAGFEAAAPDGAVRWRFEPGGRVFRSRDAGESWQVQAFPATSADLLSASAPSPTTCWAVGRRGAVVLTANGEEWKVMSFPEPVDLVRVEARDARTAAGLARDGRAFTTGDGGLTWTTAPRK